MGESKTGWTGRREVAMLCQDDLHPVKSGESDKRLCFRWDELPEQMMRAELREKIEWGWEMLSPSGHRAVIMRMLDNGQVTFVHLNQCTARHCNLDEVTRARPPAAIGTDTWIRIVDKEDE